MWVSFKTYKQPGRLASPPVTASANTEFILCAELPAVPGLTSRLSWSPSQALSSAAPRLLCPVCLNVQCTSLWAWSWLPVLTWQALVMAPSLGKNFP